MKKTRTRKSDDLRPEYDLRELGPGVRGKYYKRAIAGPIIVELRAERPAAKPKKRRSTARTKASRK